jgi:hypothetical protein|tara:strand:- start:307 stop:459 length:153 start_codon:yes stop_codon:yes gene_type:complete
MIIREILAKPHNKWAVYDDNDKLIIMARSSTTCIQYAISLGHEPKNITRG